jgi:transcriptional regulator with XRE-family HTH domain
MSQEQLARTTGLHRTHISLLERSQRLPNLETIVKLSRALGIPPGKIVEWHSGQAKLPPAEARRHES